MANPQATPAASKADVEQEISWLGARLREKSTYAGLTVAVSLILPLLTKYIPGLADASSAQIVNDISMIGIGLGGLIAIVCPEKAAKAVAAFLAIVAALALSFPGQAHALVRHHRVHVSQAVPAPKPDPRPLFDVVNCIGSTNLPIGCKPNPVVAAATPSPATVKENILATAPADIAYAIQLATQANTPQSNVRKMCYQAILAAIPQTPSGTTLPPGPDVVTHIEQGSELLDSLQPSSPVFVNCAGAAALAGQSVLTFVNAVVTGIAGIAVVAPKIP